VARCPACGSESPDSAQWCDLCKEPFRKVRPAPALGASATAVKTKDQKAADPEETIPPEFLALDSGGKIPSLPNGIRCVAWSVLGVWLVAMLVLLGKYIAMNDARENAASVQQPFQRQ